MPIAAIVAGVGMGLAGAGIQAHEASKASQAQQQSEQQALALQKQIYDSQVQRTQPYVDAGYRSLNGLLNTFGNPQSFQGQLAGYTSQLPGRGVLPPSMTNPNVYGGAPQLAPQGLAAYNPMGGIAPQQPGGGPMPPGFGGGGLVTVRDDTGETRQVPQAQAQLYAQRGFQVMG